MIRRPLADVYYVESWKRYNWENTDHNILDYDDSSGRSLSFV